MIRLLLSLSGLIVWANCFVVLYGALSLGCVLRLDQRVITLALLLLWALHLGLLGWLLWRFHGQGSFLFRLTGLVAAIGLVSTLWIGWPMLMLPPCL